MAAGIISGGEGDEEWMEREAKAMQRRINNHSTKQKFNKVLMDFSKEDPMEISTAKVVEILSSRLLNDKEYRMSWIANIAIAFQDTYAIETAQGNHDIHDISNKAAEDFLNLLTRNF